MDDIVYVIAVATVGVGLVIARMAAIDRRLERLVRLEAKVDALLEAAGISYDPYRNAPAGVREALERGETIPAIKRFREATGAGLKEAKEFVDELRRRGSGGTIRR